MATGHPAHSPPAGAYTGAPAASCQGLLNAEGFEELREQEKGARVIGHQEHAGHKACGRRMQRELRVYFSRKGVGIKKTLEELGAKPITVQPSLPQLSEESHLNTKASLLMCG